jgi:outer membrane protein assembly factor BamE
MTFNRPGKLPLIALLLAPSMLGACSGFMVHRIDVRQGNALEPEAVEQLEVGMTTEQVRYLLGNPMIDDSYHVHRWDYVYYFDPGEGQTRERQLTVFFKHGEVVRIKPPQTDSRRLRAKMISSA